MIAGSHRAERTGSPGVLTDLRNLRQHADLLLLLTQKELKVKYKGTALGFLWSLLNPLLLMAVYVLVFSVIVRFTMPNYSVFVLSGILPWTAFTSSVTAAATSIIVNSNLVRRVAFPVQSLTLSSVFAGIVNLLPGFAVLLAFVLVLPPHRTGWPLLALPLVVLLQAAFTVGIALILASVTVYFRDAEYLVGLGLTVWFFGTPILYPASIFAGKRTGAILQLNPMTWLMASYQSIWHDNRWPDWGSLGGFALVAAVAVIAGLFVFNRLSRRFAEEV